MLLQVILLFLISSLQNSTSISCFAYQVESSTVVTKERAREQLDPEVVKYLELCNNLKLLEDKRHEEKVHICIFSSNLENLATYSNCEPNQKEKIASRVKHIEESLEELKEKTKETVQKINDTHEKILLLKQIQQVSTYVEKQGEVEKRKRGNEENVHENERVQKKKKNNPTEGNQHPDSESSNSEFDEEEREKENEEEYAKEMEVEKAANGITKLLEEEATSEVDDYDDREEYENAQCGEKDESILPGSRIQVYWKGNKLWFKGTVVGWDDNKKVYLINYDDELDLEPMEEHLTGPSKEKWRYARATRKCPRKSAKGNEMDKQMVVCYYPYPILFFLSNKCE